jgi:hypothetical protein
MKKWLLYKWDRLAYKLAYGSLTRIMISSPMMCYAFKLHIDAFLEDHPTSPEQERQLEEIFKGNGNVRDPKTI